MSMPKIMNIINKIITPQGTVTSAHADYAEIGEWSDGNPNGESRLGYFVSVDTSKAGGSIVKSNSTSDVRGVTIANPGYATNATKDKFDTNGNLKNRYVYVGFIGFVNVIDNGTCTINGRCMPAADGTAIPSTNNLGYQVIDRIDENRILISLEPQSDKIQRIKTKIDNTAPKVITQAIDVSIDLSGSDAWTWDSVGRVYMKKIAAEGMTKDSVFIFSIKPSDVSIISGCNILCTDQELGKITITATKLPETSFGVQLTILG